jgi:hypothetical protein
MSVHTSTRQPCNGSVAIQEATASAEQPAGADEGKDISTTTATEADNAQLRKSFQIRAAHTGALPQPPPSP